MRTGRWTRWLVMVAGSLAALAMLAGTPRGNGAGGKNSE